MDRGEQLPGSAEINAAADQISVGIGVGYRGRVGEADAQRVSSLLSTAGVEHEVSSDAKDPCPRIVLVLRRFRKAPPDDEKCLSHYVLGMCRVCAALNELEQVSIGGLIQRPKGFFLVGGSREVAHTQYLSATYLSVLHSRDKFLELRGGCPPKPGAAVVRSRVTSLGQT